GVKVPAGFERRECVGRARDADRWIGSAVRGLEHLHEELRIDGAAWAPFEISLRGSVFQPHAHLPNLGCEFGTPRRVERRSGDDLHRMSTSLFAAEHRPGLAQSLSFPQLRWSFGEISIQGVEGN